MDDEMPMIFPLKQILLASPVLTGSQPLPPTAGNTTAAPQSWDWPMPIQQIIDTPIPQPPALPPMPLGPVIINGERL